MSHAHSPFDWNQPDEALLSCRTPIQFQDETLRDGLQCPSVTDPPIEGKLEILHLMARLGIHGADVGLPGAGPRAVADCTRIVEEIRNHRLSVKPSCAGRTLRVDIDPIADISDQTGVVLEADLFLGCSPVRQYAEGWTLDSQLRIVDEAVSYAVKRGLEVMFVTEDTIRSHPDTLRRLYTAAIDCGAVRICLCDTVGHATPEGVRALIGFMRQVVRESGAQVAIDWHGHRDRGLDVANTLAAVEAGADRIHGTALGIGERVGNTPMEHLLLNLRLAGVIKNDLTALSDYVDAVRRHCQVPLPENWPGLGRDSFRVVSMERQRAVQDALERGKLELAENLFSSVPPSLVGRCLQVSKESRS
jgi:2-isopropylmalate synthase